MIPESALYVGTITHRRFAPKSHQFRYSLFMALLDIDRIDELMAASTWTSLNRWNWSSFHDRDHLGDVSLPRRDRVRASAAAAGRTLPDGKIFLLTHMRYAGYVFNPISIYYCFDRAGGLASVLADVRNTYGGRRSYWLDRADAPAHRFHAFTDKTMYVSPFMAMEVRYEFLLTVPGAGLVTHINVARCDTQQKVFDATLDLERRPWSAAAIQRTLLEYPLMTARVIAGIYVQAMRLRLQGFPEIPSAQGRQ